MIVVHLISDGSDDVLEGSLKGLESRHWGSSRPSSLQSSECKKMGGGNKTIIAIVVGGVMVTSSSEPSYSDGHLAVVTVVHA